MAAISDNFTRADNVDLSVGAPFSWTDLAGDFQIVANQVKSTSATNINNRSRAESDLASSNMRASVAVIALAGNVNRHVEALARYSSAADTAYGVRMSGPSGGASAIRLFKLVAGVYTLLGTGTSVTFLEGDFIKIEVDGAAPNIELRSYHNGVLQETITGESSIDTGLRAGIGNNGNNASVSILDAFSAADLAAAARQSSLLLTGVGI